MIVKDETRKDLTWITSNNLVVIRNFMKTTGKESRSLLLDKHVMRVVSRLKIFAIERRLFARRIGLFDDRKDVSHQHPTHHKSKTLLVEIFFRASRVV